MELITSEQREQLLQPTAQTGAPDHVPVLKLFNPCGAGTWLVTELDPEDASIAFGLADLGFGTPEIGSFSYRRVRMPSRGPFGLGIERDLYFEGKFTLAVYAEAARAAGRIVEYGPELDDAGRRRSKSAATCG